MKHIRMMLLFYMPLLAAAAGSVELPDHLKPFSDYFSQEFNRIPNMQRVATRAFVFRHAIEDAQGEIVGALIQQYGDGLLRAPGMTERLKARPCLIEVAFRSALQGGQASAVGKLLAQYDGELLDVIGILDGLQSYKDMYGRGAIFSDMSSSIEKAFNRVLLQERIVAP